MKIIPIENILKLLERPDFVLDSDKTWIKMTGEKWPEERQVAIYLLEIIQAPQGENINGVVTLIREATQADCSDERMGEIVKQLEPNKKVALALIPHFNHEYVRISSPSSPPKAQTVAYIQQTQVFRLENMLKGEKPLPRLVL